MKIEDLWASLRGASLHAQRRVDARHPLDLYADFESPDRPGLLLVCNERPPDAPALAAIGLERCQRHDGRWSLRILLERPNLLPVFAELCRDVIEATRSGVDPIRPGGAVLSRIGRWQSLLDSRSIRLGRSQLRGLIGELLVLERLLATLTPDAAVRSWVGPMGTDQDFRLPGGLRIEVKAIEADADQVHINGLGQLDGGGDPLELAAVRLKDTGEAVADALTPSRLVARLRTQLAATPVAAREFEALLSFVGWDDGEDADTVAVRLIGIDWHVVQGGFPRLTAITVPDGVVEATYVIRLPSLAAPND